MNEWKMVLARAIMKGQRTDVKHVVLGLMSNGVWHYNVFPANGITHNNMRRRASRDRRLR